MDGSRAETAAQIERLLETEGETVSENLTDLNQGRYESVDRLDEYDAYKTRARSIKADAIERLPELIETVSTAVEANGGSVYLADDADDANRYIREVVQEENAETVVKSKSMTTEEIECNEALSADGVSVWETDLGEFVLQVADESPSHIVVPAIHKSRAAIAELFNETFELDEPLETPAELTNFAREHLGAKIRAADVGITGANFIAADTGTIALVTSEGNARKTVAVPDTQITVAGVEKLLPTLSDLQPFVELIGRSGTGQDITSYVSLFTPPVETPPVPFDDPDTPIADGNRDRTFHLVLIDNGRLAVRDDPQLRETLYCIRCSACLNSCANFQHVGGHAFGGETYSGGIATGWEATVEGIDSAATFNDLCTGCTRCVNQCPVNIDIPWINTVVRDRINRSGDADAFSFLVDPLVPDTQPDGLDPQKRFFGSFERVATLASKTAPVSNWLPKLPGVRSVLERTLGIDHRRELPQFKRETLRSWFHSRDGPALDTVRRMAVLYPDCYTNTVHVERGKAAVRVLEALGVAVEMPAIRSSGRAPLSQGMIDTARSHASAVAADLIPLIDDGRDVVVIEPGELAMFRSEYEKLLDGERAEPIATASYDLFEYIYGLLENGGDLTTLEGAAEPVAYHAHCQQRTLGLESYTTAVLERLGFDVIESDVECCGMAGSFGYKSEYYDLSVDVGTALTEQFQTPATSDRTVVASGTSCSDQLDDLLERTPRHPIELLDSHTQNS
ncbi:LUD domain-containing protein [Halocatena halophila]|uniref:LUD domain-containing protein n=1 Tax=Halocatena halophila TaxID=2814576 RepID=UPI002ED1FB9D